MTTDQKAIREGSLPMFLEAVKNSFGGLPLCSFPGSLQKAKIKIIVVLTYIVTFVIDDRKFGYG
jgi:hypothetical protein